MRGAETFDHTPALKATMSITLRAPHTAAQA